MSGYDSSREALANYAEREAPYIRARLEKLASQIEGVGHGATRGYWVGDKGAKAQIRHDWNTGRFAWDTAWAHCRRGLKALDEGDYDLALTYLLEAQAQSIAALAVRLQAAARKGEGLEKLGKPTGRAGAPRKHPATAPEIKRPRGRPRKRS